jgi:predicted RNA-binding Zn-ribbon protein involved in translation (DUF1610 family)
MFALAIATQLEQEVAIPREAISARNFECPDKECGAVFSYRRVSCGHFVQPEFCPTCGGAMYGAPEDVLMIVPADDAFLREPLELESDQLIPLRFQRSIAGSR